MTEKSILERAAHAATIAAAAVTIVTLVVSACQISVTAKHHRESLQSQAEEAAVAAFHEYLRYVADNAEIFSLSYEDAKKTNQLKEYLRVMDVMTYAHERLLYFMTKEEFEGDEWQKVVISNIKEYSDYYRSDEFNHEAYLYSCALREQINIALELQGDDRFGECE